MTPIEIYAASVREKAIKPTDYLFHNEGNAHALIICRNIFSTAESKIRIAANQLYNDEVVNTPEYIDAMRGFLDKHGTSLDVIICTAPDIDKVRQNNTFYGMLFNHAAYSEGRVTIKVGDGKSFKDETGTIVNFCIGDDRMYRFEDNTERRTAIANFKDHETAKELSQKFDEVFNGLTHTLNLSEYFA